MYVDDKVFQQVIYIRVIGMHNYFDNIQKFRSNKLFFIAYDIIEIVFNHVFLVAIVMHTNLMYISYGLLDPILTNAIIQHGVDPLPYTIVYDLMFIVTNVLVKLNEIDHTTYIRIIDFL